MLNIKRSYRLGQLLVVEVQLLLRLPSTSQECPPAPLRQRHSHLPLRLATFTDREPMFLTHTEVLPHELEGYNLWKETADGSVFE